ncbi:hypothetical protein [Pseudofrankia sp. BMG5.37]|uniref:hypothetical protein n=1 Tax=Pseudofrankia sp. BMG5.37 TaxID=3050035 RepID=UPI002895F529|nr:hypothetical protein [Pseudofrankia sp. BMG5.37]MDT3444994.1 hypothetical protein [Pseudofrankia sp. BMG5.37]
MRKSRMRAVMAGAVGAAVIAVGGPAWAASPSPSTSPEATTSPSASPTATATPLTNGLAVTVSPPAITLPTATATSTGTPTPEASLTSTAVTSASPTATGTPGVIVVPGFGEIDFKKGCDTFNSFSPIKVPCDKEINGIEDFEVNPLLITATCGPNGPDWTIKNTGAKALGFGWFDINLGGGISTIAPGETQKLNSHSKAVIASPWDAATNVLLVAIPAVGFSTCPGAPAVPAIPANLPVAPPAAAVPGTPHFTG